MSQFDEIVDELYGSAPEEFVKRRNELAKAAKDDGDRDLAARVTKLRRPTQSAWAVNQWVRANPDDSALIAQLAADLSAAQRRSAADKMRELSRRRQQLLTASADGVARTAARSGITLADSAIREVTQTLRAAVADEEVLDQVMHGRLVSAVEYSGFGPAGVFVVPDPVASPAPGSSASKSRPSTSKPASTSDTDGSDAADARAEEADRARRELESHLAGAEKNEKAARATLTEASQAVEAVSAEIDELAGQAQELREKLARCEEEMRFARQRLTAAERGRSEAKVGLREAVASANDIRTALAEL
jgi:hypothetical protein